ncbi:MAG TPA: alkaline phosphatase family protein, partial [Anaerolineae bacterium]|nr:alkaline phosphatase family protein [Anaerolineae bacterium]
RAEAVEEAYTLLKRELDGYAEVVKTAELIQNGYFGKPPVCADLPGRLGEIAILPYGTNCVWWYEEGKFEQKYYGHHGGLTPAEAEIPLALLDLSA